MKKFLLIALIFPMACFAQKSNSPSFADSMMYLRSIANNSFNELHPLHKEKYETLPIRLLGADEVTLYDNGMVGGYELWLSYYKTNPENASVEKQMKKFMNKLDGTGDYKFQHFLKPDPFTLEEKRVRVFALWPETEPSSKEAFRLVICQTIPSEPVFADEAAYKNQFPSSMTKSDAPQIVQISNGNGPGSYMRFNGIFGKPGLLSGKLTIHGFGDFYDGTWISKEWHPADSKRINTQFIPANTTDTIYGVLLDSSMADFSADTRYSGYVRNKYYHITPDAPKWVTIAEAQSMAMYEARQRARDAAASSSSSNTETYTNPYSNNSNNNSRSTYRLPCYCCHGTGKVQQKTNKVYDVRDRYGNSRGTTSYIDVNCPCCGGSGKQL